MVDDDTSTVEGEGYRLTIGPYVALGDRHFPEWLEIELFGFDEPNSFARVELRNEVPRLVEVAWRASPGSREIMPKDLRDNDLSSIIDFYSTFAIIVDHDERLVKVSYEPDDEVAKQAREFVLTRRSGQKRRITGTFLQEVAAVYRDNIGHAPTAAVARRFGVKHRQATDYVKQARDRGFLPPTKQGRAQA